MTLNWSVSFLTLLVFLLSLCEVHPKVNTRNLLEKLAILIIGFGAIIGIANESNMTQKSGNFILIIGVVLYFAVFAYKSVARKYKNRLGDKK